MADVKIKQESTEEIENRIKELCQQFPQGITDQVIQNDMPQLEAQHRAKAINRLLSLGQLDLLRNSSGLLYRMKDTQTASKMKGSDNQEKLFYLVVEGAGRKVKRRRKPNWTQDQMLLLAQLVHKRKDIIKGKFGLGITSRIKKEAWENICTQVNAAFPSLPRTSDECEKRWYSLQSQARAEIAEHRRQAAATGVASLLKNLSPTASVVYSVLGYSQRSVSAGQEGGVGPARGMLEEPPGANGSVGGRGGAPGCPPFSCPPGPCSLPPGPLLFSTPLGPGLLTVGPPAPGPLTVGPPAPGPLSLGPQAPGPLSLGPPAPGPISLGPVAPGPISLDPPASGPLSLDPPGPGPLSLDPPGPSPLSQGPLAPGFLSPPSPAPASPPAAGDGSLLEQKLQLEISLLRKQHALVDKQHALVDRQHRLLDVQEEYYCRRLKISLPDPPQIKEEQELWSSQGGEQLQALQFDSPHHLMTSPRVNTHCDQDDSPQLPPPTS